jgi:MraZ protein
MYVSGELMSRHLLLGTFNPKVDDKGRVILPSKIRPALEDGLVMTRGDEKCITVMSEQRFNKVYKKLLHDNISDRDAALRMFASAATLDQFDGQGRLLLPENLREYAGIKKDLAVIGTGKCLEIWDAAVWEDYRARNVDALAQIPKVVF